MKQLYLILPVVVFLSCTPEPRPIAYGEDKCDFCRMTIVDRQHAAEIVTLKGRAMKYDAVECMVDVVIAQGQEEYAMLLVNDFLGNGELIRAENCTYLISPEVPSPMGAFLSAFASEADAADVRNEKGGELFTWEELLQYRRG